MIAPWVNWASGWPAFWAYSASLSRSGPILAFVPAGVNVWQLPQPPTEMKTVFPFAGLPVAVVGVVDFGRVPTTVCGVGVAVPWAPHPAAIPVPSSAAAATPIVMWRRRIGASLSCAADRQTQEHAFGWPPAISVSIRPAETSIVIFTRPRPEACRRIIPSSPRETQPADTCQYAE